MRTSDTEQIFDMMEKRLDREITSVQRDMLLQHVELVIARNKEMNLTRIDGIEDGLLLHVEDSLSALPEMEAAPEGRFCDIGTGAGFPGIPLAIMTGREGVLIDSVKKKARCVSDFCEELGLDDVSASGLRAEELAVEMRGSFAVVTARALTSLPALVELASPLLRKGGVLIAMKAKPSTAEIEAGRAAAPMVGMMEEDMRRFLLGGKDISRTIITYRKKGSGSVKLPRNTGSAQKHPLVAVEK